MFEKERVKGFEPPFEAWCEAGTSTLARGGAGVRSREAGAACASRGFALHRGLHGLAAVGGSGCPGSAGSGDADDLICRANFVGARAPARSRARRPAVRRWWTDWLIHQLIHQLFRMWLSKVGSLEGAAVRRWRTDWLIHQLIHQLFRMWLSKVGARRTHRE
jgi:hypothetical protein